MKHILLVDDVSTNLKCVGLILKNKYDVTMVKSGRDALNVLRTAIPDLILLDIRMQDMNGYEVMQHLKEDPRTMDIPVILLTADTEEGSREKGISLGAVDFIRKPIDPEMLLKRIEAIWRTEDQVEWE